MQIPRSKLECINCGAIKLNENGGLLNPSLPLKMFLLEINCWGINLLFLSPSFALLIPVLWSSIISMRVLPTPNIAPGPPEYVYKFRSVCLVSTLSSKPNSLLLGPSALGVAIVFKYVGNPKSELPSRGPTVSFKFKWI